MLRSVLVASALLWACGQTARLVDPRADAAAEGGSSAGVPPMSSGGSAADGGDADGSAGTGTGGSNAAAGSSNAGGTDAGGAAAIAGSSAVSTGGVAGADAVAPTIDLCAVASLDGKQPLEQSDLISADYRQIIFDDCHFSGLGCGFDFGARATLANLLRRYGPLLWHCEGQVTDAFGLVYSGRKVTQADGEALVELYVTFTTRRLLLPDNYAIALREELLALMPGSVDPDAAPISICANGGACPPSGESGGSSTSPSGQAGTN